MLQPTPFGKPTRACYHYPWENRCGSRRPDGQQKIPRRQAEQVPVLRTLQSTGRRWPASCKLAASTFGGIFWQTLPKCRSSASPIYGKAHHGRLYIILTAGEAQTVPTLVQLRSHRRRAKSRCYIRRRLVQVLRAPLSVESGGRVTARTAGPR